jgi:peptidoglycan/LPS O-acetylase OafA/YrhL
LVGTTPCGVKPLPGAADPRRTLTRVAARPADVSATTSPPAPTAPPAVGSRPDAAGEPLDYDRFRATRYFPSLDGVRAVAILMVFTAHIGYQGLWGHFVLSGFLITTLALREESRNGSVSLRSFYLRRLFRIYPMYLFTIALYCVLIYGAGFQSDRRGAFSHQLPYYLLGFPENGFFAFQHNGGGPPFDGAWSIGIEEKFYLLWPFVGFVLLAGVLRPRLTIMVVSAIGFAVAPVIFRNGAYLGPYLFIALGCIVALLAHERRHFERLRPLGRPGPLGAAIAAFVALQLILGSGADGRGYEVLSGLAIAVALAGVVISTGRTNRFLAWRPMVVLGEISYVFYLLHNFAINAVEHGPLAKDDALTSIVVAVPALALAIAISYALSKTVERPFIRIGHRLAHRDKPLKAV